MEKQTNIIGIIGGMGPQASNELYRLLIDRARNKYGARNNHEYPEILIDSVPVPDFLSDTEKMEEAALLLEDRVKRLTKFGVTTITMACNTACILADRLRVQTNVQIISVVDEMVKEVAKTNSKVLLLASPTSLRMGLYQLVLARYNIPYVVPDSLEYQELEFIIREVIEGGDRGMLMRKLIKITEQCLQKSDIGGIVLGCTELPLIFPSNFRLPVYNSLSILAEALLKQYYYRKEEI